MKHVTLILAIALLTGCAGDTLEQVQVTATVTPSPPACIHINTANGVQLESLPGIGPELAWRIAQHIAANGPFQTVEDLADVDGIGPETLERLRPHVCVP